MERRSFQYHKYFDEELSAFFALFCSWLIRAPTTKGRSTLASAYGGSILLLLLGSYQRAKLATIPSGSHSASSFNSLPCLPIRNSLAFSPISHLEQSEKELSLTHNLTSPIPLSSSPKAKEKITHNLPTLHPLSSPISPQSSQNVLHVDITGTATWSTACPSTPALHL